MVVDCTLVKAAEGDFDFVYELKKIAYKDYVDQTWGWDDAFQLKYHATNFAMGNTRIIKAGNVSIGSIDITESEGSLFISGLYLLPSYQSKGIGTKMIKDLLVEAGSKGKRLELEVLKVNTRALQLYERLGFQLCPERSDQYKYAMYKEVSAEDGKENVQIIDFNDSLVDKFAELNKAWLQRYFEVEPIDLKIFANPRSYIIDTGGYIFFATLNEKVAGTFALMKVEEGIFELSKMAVDEAFQHRKIGNHMVRFAISKAAEIGAEKLILYSNRALRPAIHLYQKYGFKEVPLGNVEYKRADIKMEIELKRAL